MTDDSPATPTPPPSALATGNWSPADDALLVLLYSAHTRQEIAQRLNRSVDSVRSRCWTLGLNSKHSPAWAPSELSALGEYYRSRQGRPVDLGHLQTLFPGRSKSNICRKARELGLTDIHRPGVEQRKDRRVFKGDEAALKSWMSARSKKLIAENGHPRGALGMKHSEATKRILAEKSRQGAIRRTLAGQRPTAEQTYSRARRGRREDLGDTYFRSSWEANWARYLNLLKGQGQIRAWSYEPRTFTFHGEVKGVISYTPDFLVTEPDGQEHYEEVKGWTTSKDRTKWKRMSKHFPDIRLDVIDAKVYREVAKKAAPFIANWEYENSVATFTERKPVCATDTCERPVAARGFCKMHYQRIRAAERKEQLVLTITPLEEPTP